MAMDTAEHNLTDEEVRVLRLIFSGKSLIEAAKDIGCCKREVSTTIKAIYEKFSIENVSRRELFDKAKSIGLLEGIV